MSRRYAPRVACLICLLPFLLCYGSFARLWFFGDDWALLSEMAQMGFIAWLMHPFAENLVPLYKLIWAAAIHLFHGSYLALSALLWAVHLLNLLLLAKVLARLRVPDIAIVCAVLSAGMPWTNIESLAWSVQLTGLLSTSAYLFAWIYLEGGPLFFLFIAAAPLFHSRGLLNGLAIGGALLFFGKRTQARTAITSIGISAGLAAAVYVLAARQAAPRLQPGTLEQMAVFALRYLTLNPLLRILSLPVEAGWIAIALMGILKALIVAHGFQVGPRPVRPFLLSAILLDLGYAAILGYGRFHTGLDIAVSSRYQYLSWICFAPFLGIAVDNLLARVPLPLPKIAAAAVILVAWALFLAWPWGHELRGWSQWRGSEVREMVWSAIPEAHLRGITVARARVLAQRYHLH